MIDIGFFSNGLLQHWLLISFKSYNLPCSTKGQSFELRARLLNKAVFLERGDPKWFQCPLLQIELEIRVFQRVTKYFCVKNG